MLCYERNEEKYVPYKLWASICSHNVFQVGKQTFKNNPCADVYNYNFKTWKAI